MKAVTRAEDWEVMTEAVRVAAETVVVRGAAVRAEDWEAAMEEGETEEEMAVVMEAVVRAADWEVVTEVVRVVAETVGVKRGSVGAEAKVPVDVEAQAAEAMVKLQSKSVVEVDTKVAVVAAGEGHSVQRRSLRNQFLRHRMHRERLDRRRRKSRRSHKSRQRMRSCRRTLVEAVVEVEVVKVQLPTKSAVEVDTKAAFLVEDVEAKAAARAKARAVARVVAGAAAPRAVARVVARAAASRVVAWVVKAAMVVGAMAEVLRGVSGALLADVEATAVGKAEAKGEAAGMVLDRMEAARTGEGKAPAGGWVGALVVEGGEEAVKVEAGVARWWEVLKAVGCRVVASVGSGAAEVSVGWAGLEEAHPVEVACPVG